MTRFSLAALVCLAIILNSNLLGFGKIVHLVSGARPSNGIDALYASSLFRSAHLLENVPQISREDNVPRLFYCLLACMHAKVSCKAFNYAHNGTCILLGESLCANETNELTQDEAFNYYDLMNTPDYEKKYLSDQYCQVYGKCSGSCYPRKPLFVEEEKNRDEAAEYCRSIGRKLAQPKSQAENIFYGEFGRKSYRKIVEMSNVDLNNRTIANRAEKQMKDAKYWIGISDDEFEGYWLYDDGSPVSDQFSAWAVAQPDNGGTGFGAKPENCAAIEMREYNWIDVTCDERLHFFCA